MGNQGLDSSEKKKPKEDIFISYFRGIRIVGQKTYHKCGIYERTEISKDKLNTVHIDETRRDFVDKFWIYNLEDL